MRLLLDSSVLIDALRSRKGRRPWLTEMLRLGHSLETSALNIAEVYAGMRPTEEIRTKQFLDALLCHAITSATGEQAGKFKSEWARRGRTLSLPDMIVAAVAVEEGCVLVTDNRKDFPMSEVHLYEISV